VTESKESTDIHAGGPGSRPEIEKKLDELGKNEWEAVSAWDAGYFDEN